MIFLGSFFTTCWLELTLTCDFPKALSVNNKKREDLSVEINYATSICEGEIHMKNLGQSCAIVGLTCIL